MPDQHALQPHHIADRDHRKRHGVRAAGRRIDAARTRRPLAPAQHIRAHHEVTVGIERLAGPDHVVPPARLAAFMADAGGVRVAGKSVRDQDGVRAIGVELAVRLIGDFDRS